MGIDRTLVMLTPDDLIRAIVFPLLLAAALGALGHWWKKGALAPIAAGGAFLAAFALEQRGMPALPPRDGTDWIFWLAIPMSLLGCLASKMPARHSWPIGLFAGYVAWMIVRPLPSSSVAPSMVLTIAAELAAVGVGHFLIADIVAKRIGQRAVLLGFSMILGAAGLVVLSSNDRTVGVFGLIAASAMAPAAIFPQPLAAVRGVVVLFSGLLVAVLVSGRFYADGFSLAHFWILLASPMVLLIGAALPVGRVGVRAIVSLVILAAALGAVVVPTALAAKKAAEADPYSQQSSFNSGVRSTHYCLAGRLCLPRPCVVERQAKPAG